MKQLQKWSREDVISFLARQIVHTGITLAIVSLFFWGVMRAGALNKMLTPAYAVDSSLTTVNYQGRLADSNGDPVNDPGVSMTFALYAVDSGGSSLWSEVHANVPVTDGLFNVKLGSMNALTTELLTGDLWLEIQVGTDAPMSPREKLTAVPFAMQANSALTVADNSITSAKIANGVVESRHFSPAIHRGFNTTSDSTTNITPNLVPTGNSVTFNCETDCVAHILHRGLIVHSVANGRVDVIVRVDGAPVFWELGIWQANFEPVSGYDFVNLTAGSHTVDVQYACSPQTPSGTCIYYGDASGDWESLTVTLYSQ